MTKLISQTVVPAQPGYFKLWAWRGNNGEVLFQKETIIAWVVSIYSGFRNDDPHSVCADPVGADALLRFIDDMNAIRARSGNRYRFEPKANKDSGVLEMREFLAVPRPDRADTPSPRFAGHTQSVGE